MTLNELCKKWGLQTCWQTESQQGARAIIRIPNGKQQDKICDELYKLLWEELELPYYWQPRDTALFCVVLPNLNK